MLWDVDLWREMDRMRREMDSLLGDSGRSYAAASYPLVNMYEDNDNLVVTAELPGTGKDDVSVTYSDGVLTIAGRRAVPERVKSMTEIRRERATGEFQKTIRVPSKVTSDKMSASFTNGVLTVTMPKAEEAKPRTISIEAK